MRECKLRGSPGCFALREIELEGINDKHAIADPWRKREGTTRFGHATFETDKRISSLCRDVDRFRKRRSRAEDARSHAVEKVVGMVRKRYESTNTRRVKRPDGRIEDWVRDIVVELVALDGVPTALTTALIALRSAPSVCCFCCESCGDRV
jgi:hypothetical protein